MNCDKISVDRIRELFSYDPETGDVWRKVPYGKRGESGFIFRGEKVIVDGIAIVLTHIIWVLHHGDWPPNGYWIDHKSTIHSDNRIVNLRLATPTENQQNKAGSGQYPKGVTWRDRQVRPWQAKIRVNGERIHLGSFEHMEDAADAYRRAAIQYHGEFACLK